MVAHGISGELRKKNTYLVDDVRAPGAIHSWTFRANRSWSAHSWPKQVHLQDLLDANRSLLKGYLMRTGLKALWTPGIAWAGRSARKRWLCPANKSTVPALIQLAKRLKGHWRGIVSRVCWPMRTGQVEGINNWIKVFKRMAYSYRDSEIVFVKIKSGFHGNPWITFFMRIILGAVWALIALKRQNPCLR